MISDVTGFNSYLNREIMYNYDDYAFLVGSGVTDFFLEKGKSMFMYAQIADINIILFHFLALFIEIKTKMELLRKIMKEQKPD